jgi:ABC-type transport system involved in multi-copper enzyme maturation permease subunit
MKSKNALTASSLSILYYIRQRRVIIILGAVLLAIGFFGAISIGSIVINDTSNNKLTPQGYPETEFLGISAFSYEYALVFTAILGVFVLFGGLVGMDSKKKMVKK